MERKVKRYKSFSHALLGLTGAWSVAVIVAMFYSGLDKMDGLLVIAGLAGVGFIIAYILRDIYRNKRICQELLDIYGEELRTSDEWEKLDKSGITVLDPDGWDRKNFEYSFYQKRISKEEYDKRVLHSTCEFSKEFLEGSKKQ